MTQITPDRPGPWPRTAHADPAPSAAAPDPDAAAAFRKVVETVRARFVADAANRAAELERFLGQIVSGRAAAEGLEGVRGMAHKIRGIAATIGETELGRIAAEVETTVDAMTAGASDRDALAARFVTGHRQLVAGLRALAAAP